MKHSKKHSHHDRASASFHASHPRCSCGNPDCEVMEIVRLIAETTDNYLLLQASLHTIERQLLPLLEQIHRDQQASLSHWQNVQDDYRAQMAASSRPTMRWQPFSPLEEDFFRRTRWTSDWYRSEQQRLEARRERLQEAMRNHEAHLEECARRFVSQPLLPACLPGMAAVLQEHLERIEMRVPDLQQKVEQQAQQLADLQRQYQAEVKRLQAGAQGTDQALAFGQREATTQWVVKNLFGLGTPQSLSLTRQVTAQLKATNQLQTHVRLQQHFFWYCEQMWRLCERVDAHARVQILLERQRHWTALSQHLQTHPDPATIQIWLLTPAP